ncbi:MAG: hypothetical protein ACTSPS_03865 [Promethearchaeota archaeon]
MKEETKYNNYRFIGKTNVDEIQPWFDFASNKPWDEEEIPWVVENKVRREILIKLAESPKSFDEMVNNINFSPKPLLISEEEYGCKVSYQWDKETLRNHLMNLEWYNLIHKKGDKYELTFPILTLDSFPDLEKSIIIFAENWIKIIKQLKQEKTIKLGDVEEKSSYLKILIEKAVEKLYELLKKENILPNIPNIKVLWAEQLRKIKFEEWIDKNF